MNLAPPDYLVLALAAGGAVTGLFIGVSGALAFLAGTAGAVLTGHFGWPLSSDYFGSALARGVAVAIASLLAFWIVRTLVRRTVKFAVAQPGDAIFGALLAAASGLAVGLGLVWLGQFLGVPGAEGSVLLGEVIGNVG